MPAGPAPAVHSCYTAAPHGATSLSDADKVRSRAGDYITAPRSGPFWRDVPDRHDAVRRVMDAVEAPDHTLVVRDDDDGGLRLQRAAGSVAGETEGSSSG
jgi:hypothetical protein